EIRPPQFPCISRAGRGAIAARGRALYGVRVGLPAPERIGPVAQRLEPTAHNGLVGGSNPPGPTIFNAFRVRPRFDRSRMFAFRSVISLVHRWQSGGHPPLGTRGSQFQTLPLRPTLSTIRKINPDSFPDRYAQIVCYSCRQLLANAAIAALRVGS